MAPLQRLRRKILSPFLDQKPASRLIRQTARKQWPLISLSLLSSFLQAACEGLTLGVMFMAVEVLSKPSGGLADISNRYLGSYWPGLAEATAKFSTLESFSALLALAVVLKLLQGISMFAGSISTGYFSNSVSRTVTSKLHSQILDFSFACSSRYRVGELLYINGSGAGTIISQINNYSSLIMTLLMIITYIIVLITLSPWLLFAAVALGIVAMFVQRVLLPRVGVRSQRATALQTELSSRMTENIQGLRLLHTSGFLAEAASEVEKLARFVEINSRSQVKLGSLNGPITATLPIIMIAIIAWLSILLFGQKTSGILPSLVTFVISLQRLNNSIGSLTAILLSIKSNSGNLDILNSFLNPNDKDFRQKLGAPYFGLGQDIRLQEVDLSYPSGSGLALQSINITIPKGETIALVGSSGAGKSSIADLLAGLYKPSAGTILVDGIDFLTLDLTSWQKRIGVVSQDTFLFNASIADNISFGTPDATSEDVRGAAALAQAAKFIEALPDGYDTLIGERGYRLSGGQRQRLSLARALLRNPDLLILDEATSALDTESERLVQEAIDRFENKYTILVIAHRLSTIVSADRIYVLDHGRVVEEGNHTQLLAQEGRYARLWQQQVKANKANPITTGS